MVSQLDQMVPLVGELQRRAGEEAGIINSLSGDMDELKKIVKSMCVVMRNLDLDHGAHMSLADIATKPSNATLTQAWDAVLDQTQTEVPACISNQVRRIVLHM